MKLPLSVSFLVFTLFCITPVARGDSQVALPSLVQDAGWPFDAKGVVRDLRSVRLSGALEEEQAILIDDNLYLAFRPGRYSEFVLLSQHVRAFQVVPNPDGSDTLLLVRDEGVVSLRWDWNHPGYVIAQSLPAEFGTWKGVQSMWVQESAGVQMVHGYDAGAGKVRRARHSSGVWTFLEALPCQGPLRDMAFVELRADSPGQEMVWLEKYVLYVMSSDGEQVLQKIPAHPTDSIAVLRQPTEGTSDLLAQSFFADGTHWVRVWNETQSSSGFSLGAKDCTAILPRKSDRYGDHLLLTRGGLGDVDLLELHRTEGAGGWSLDRDSAGGWIDTHEVSEQMPIQAATLVDVDLDGRDDLMVAVLNGNELQLRNVMTTDLEAQRWQNLEEDVPGLLSLGDGQFEFSVRMQAPAVLPSNTVQVDLWARSDPGTPQEAWHSLGRQFVGQDAETSQLTYKQTFTASDWDPLKAHFEAVFVSVELDAQSAVSHYFPAQGLAWAAPNVQVALPDPGTVRLNFAVANQNVPRRRSRRRGRLFQASPVTLLGGIER